MNVALHTLIAAGIVHIAAIRPETSRDGWFCRPDMWVLGSAICLAVYRPKWNRLLDQSHHRPPVRGLGDFRKRSRALFLLASGQLIPLRFPKLVRFHKMGSSALYGWPPPWIVCIAVPVVAVLLLSVSGASCPQARCGRPYRAACRH